MIFYLLFSTSMPPLLPSEDPSSDEDSEVVCAFEPKVAVVVGILAALLCMTFLLVLYGRHCKRFVSPRTDSIAASSSAQLAPASASNRLHHNSHNSGLTLPTDAHGGPPQWLLDALPKLHCSLELKGVSGIVGWDECPICLSKYEDRDLLRLLPRCKHAFHIVCLDKWLVSHPSCPVCRTFVSCQDIIDLDNYFIHHDVEQSTTAKVVAVVDCQAHNPAPATSVPIPATPATQLPIPATPVTSAAIQVVIEDDIHDDVTGDPRIGALSLYPSESSSFRICGERSSVSVLQQESLFNNFHCVRSELAARTSLDSSLR